MNRAERGPRGDCSFLGDQYYRYQPSRRLYRPKDREPTPYEARANHLMSVESEGFKDDLSSRVRIIATIGLPVDKVTKLTYVRNEKGRESTLLGSWGIGNENRGEFSIYDRNDKLIPEKGLGTYVHELGHANTPFDPENNDAFGSEEAREEAAAFARLLADQTERTQVFMNPYHKGIYQQYQAGEIDRDLFVEETWAIATELAFTNRKKLQQIHSSQRLVMIGMDKQDAFVGVVSHGESLVGIDRHIHALVPELDSPHAIRSRSALLKARAYGADAAFRAAQRSQA